ncbi:uncharacterized protein LOC128734405 [Sabethes cyaneus]|uniref:uncharacterized protein LOC128734405 n=1 Tax=Sabethes cyaneus TaxID=53552 RepID=UPI00237E7E15|nr:uncharacterized protein LOC128734405 [Sabethes cyaneus]
MPRTCAVSGCSKRGGRDSEKWFRFPRLDKRTPQREELSKKRQIAWMNALQRVDLVPKRWPSTVVCSQHFISGRSADLLEETNPDWVPNQKLDIKNRNSKKLPSRRKALKSTQAENGKTVTEPTCSDTELEDVIKDMWKVVSEILLRYRRRTT